MRKSIWMIGLILVVAWSGCTSSKDSRARVALEKIGFPKTVPYQVISCEGYGGVQEWSTNLKISIAASDLDAVTRAVLPRPMESFPDRVQAITKNPEMVPGWDPKIEKAAWYGKFVIEKRMYQVWVLITPPVDKRVVLYFMIRE